MEEIYYSGQSEKKTYKMGSPESEPLCDALRQAFPWVRFDDYFSISSSADHEVLGEPVITCCLPLPATHLLMGPQYVLSARKFCMNSQTSFLRGYVLYTGEKPAWATPSSRVMFVGDNHAEYGRPAPEKLNDFTEYYLKADPDEFEAAFNLPVRRGQYETFYGVTVANGQVVRAKQYIYDQQGYASDWDVVFYMQCKHQRRLDLLGA